MPFISRSEAARALGVTPEAVYAAVKSGRLSTKKDVYGKVVVNSETMREEWAKNTQTRIGVGPKAPGKGLEKKPLRSREERMRPKEVEPRISKTDESIPDYEDSRARTEHLKAELLELDRKQKEGLLVKLEDVQHQWSEIITRARTKLLGIPTKAKQRIPDLDTDAIGVLDNIVREALEDLAADDE